MEQRVLRPFSARAYRKNAQNLDRLSREGRQLQKAGSLFRTFVRAPEVYRHALDYCPLSLGEEELARRKAAFVQAGWELVDTTHTGWRYFRRPQDSSLPETAYQPPCARTAAEDRTIVAISWLFWLRVPVVLAGAVLAVIALVRGKQMVLPAVIFLLLILILSFKTQALQQELKP